MDEINAAGGDAAMAVGDVSKVKHCSNRCAVTVVDTYYLLHLKLRVKIIFWLFVRSLAVRVSCTRAIYQGDFSTRVEMFGSATKPLPPIVSRDTGGGM